MLTKLVLRIKLVPAIINNLVAFLETQATTLVELENKCSNPRRVYECIFTKLQIKTLSLQVFKLPDEDDFYESLVVNDSIEKLIFTRFLYMPITSLNKRFSAFIKKTPNVKTVLATLMIFWTLLDL